MEGFWRVFEVTGLGSFTWGNLVMDIIGIVFIYIAIKKHYEPLLLVPIGGTFPSRMPKPMGMRSRGS